MIIFIVNDFFMRIVITENQYIRLFEQEEVKCVPTNIKWKPVSKSFYDIIIGGEHLSVGDVDEDKTHPIKVIQKKLGITRDGYYGEEMVKAIAKEIDIDLCKQHDYKINIGRVGLTDLGLKVDIPEDDEDYILASTLVGENQTAGEKELKAILSTIKNRADKCGYSMKDSVLKGKQYSTWNYYNSLNKEGKFQELLNRISNQKVKGFDRMLKIVENFSDGDVIKVNHYLNPNAIQFDLETSKKSIAQSYRNNKKSSKKIGDHIFWWDKNHSC